MKKDQINKKIKNIKDLVRQRIELLNDFQEIKKDKLKIQEVKKYGRD